MDSKGKSIEDEEFFSPLWTQSERASSIAIDFAATTRIRKVKSTPSNTCRQADGSRHLRFWLLAIDKENVSEWLRLWSGPPFGVTRNLRVPLVTGDDL